MIRFGRLTFCFLSLLSAVVVAQPTLKDSPFLPSDAPAAPPPTEGGSHEFTGVIVAGKSVLINLTEAKARRSFWLAVGKSLDGVEILGYDPKKDTVSVRISGEAKTLALKQPSVAARSGNAVATVQLSPSVPIPPPSSPAEAEREARMLVSDLLEIGIQQRKAYEEAQRKAAAEAAKNAPAPAGKKR